MIGSGSRRGRSRACKRIFRPWDAAATRSPLLWLLCDNPRQHDIRYGSCIGKFTINAGVIAIGGLRLRFAAGIVGEDPHPVVDDRLLAIHKAGRFLAEEDRFLTNHKVDAKRIVELGIFEGGSTAFWFEYFRPDKLVSIDINDQDDPPALRAYKEQKSGADEDILGDRTG